MFICFLSLFVSIQVYDAYVNVLSIIVFFRLNFSFLDLLSFLKNFCGTRYDTYKRMNVLNYKLWNTTSVSNHFNCKAA